MPLYDQLDRLPPEFLEVEACDIQQIFPRPTLIRLRGKQSPALFVSILLHGNEDAGLLAFQELFRHLPVEDLPRDLSIFVGNVDSCTMGVRYGRDQIDFNRAWPGSDLPHSQTHDLLAELTNDVVADGVWASVDVHNNTGRNPLYGCICSLEPQHVQLASLFSPKAIYFTRPKGVQTQAFMPHCPSVTVECGMIGDLAGAHAAARFLQLCLQGPDLISLVQSKNTHQIEPATSHADVLEEPFRIYHSMGRILLRDGCSVGFDGASRLTLREDLDLLNFRNLATGEELAEFRGDAWEGLFIRDAAGRECTNEFLEFSEGKVRTKCVIMPAMLTKDLAVMRQDCVGYLMKSLDA